MPDKPVETSWLRRKAEPQLRRAKRAARRAGRRARSTLRPQLGAIGPVQQAPVWQRVPALDQGARPSALGLDLILAAIPDDGQDQLPESYIEPLVLAERRSIPTVLLVRSAADLQHPLAAVVSHLAAEDESVMGEVVSFAGEERTALLDSAAPRSRQTAQLLALTRLHTRRR